MIVMMMIMRIIIIMSQYGAKYKIRTKASNNTASKVVTNLMTLCDNMMMSL